MVNEDKLRIDAARATRAQQLMENELLKEAFATLEQSYVDRWRASRVGEDAVREKLFIAINVIGKVKDHINSIVSNGAIAKKELDELERVAERKRRFSVV